METVWEPAALLTAGILCAATMAVLARGHWATRKGYVLLTWLLPLGQFATVAYTVHVLFAYGAQPWTSAATLAADVVCAAGDVLLLRGLALTYKRRHAKEEARLLQQQTRVQQEYYETLMEENAKVDRMRAAFGKRLAQVRSAVERHRETEAHGAVRQAGEELTPATVRYCPHRVVDALLWKKAQEFTYEGIAFSCTVGLPDETGVSDVVLCATFLNLLDNAQNACANLPASQRFIDLKTQLAGGYLVICVENPCMSARGHRRAEGLAAHGWGLEILRLIARDHDGELRTRAHGGVFTTRIMLRCGEGKEE